MKDEKIKDFESRFPDKKTAISLINDLQSLDLRKFTLEDLDEIIDDVFHMIPFGKSYIEIGTDLFRARKSKPNQVFNNISELGINKPENITDFGRAHEPHVPVFYCSSNLKLACGEVLQNLKKSFNPKKEMAFTTVSIWETTKRLHLAPVYYSKSVTDVREDARKYKEGNMKYIREKNIINSSTLDVQDLIIEFFCEEFSKIDIKYPDDYKLSVSYANRLKNANDLIAPEYSKERFDGLIYPSVAMKYSGDNVVLFDDNLDKKVKFKTAFQVICVDFDFDKADFKSYFMHEIESVDDKGNIIWSDEVWKPTK